VFTTCGLCPFILYVSLPTRSMALFLKAVFLLVMTGPPAISKRLNKMAASSQASTLENSQPTPVGAQTSGNAEVKPAGRKSNRDTVETPLQAALRDSAQFLDNAVKGAERWAKERQNNKKKVRQMAAAEQAGEIANTIRVKSKFEMCLNAKSGDLKKGDLIQLYSCSGAANEQFEMRDDYTIRLTWKPELCFNAKSGDLKQGDLIQLYPCSAATNEQFEMNDDSTIRAVKSNPPMCLSAKTGDLKQEDVIQLSPCSALTPNQQFLVPAQAEGKAAAKVTPKDETDRFTSHIFTLQDGAPHPADLVRQTDTSDGETQTEEEESPPDAEQPQEEPKIPPAPPASPAEKSVSQAALTPAEEAEAKWAEASPTMDVAEESAEDAEDKKKSFAHLSTVPGFSVYAVALAATAAALEIAGAK